MISQSVRLLEFLSDGRPHSTVEIMERVYGGSHLGLARVGARIFELRRKGFNIQGWHDPKNKTVYWYKLTPAKKEIQVSPPNFQVKAQGARELTPVNQKDEVNISKELFPSTAYTDY